LLSNCFLFFFIFIFTYLTCPKHCKSTFYQTSPSIKILLERDAAALVTWQVKFPPIGLDKWRMLSNLLPKASLNTWKLRPLSSGEPSCNQLTLVGG